jgi:hypothetical protein
LQGWWMVVNAHAIYDSTFGLFTRIHPILPSVTGSVDYVVSFAWILRATALLGVVCLAAEMAERSVWLVRLWYAIAIAGGSIALLGLIQKATGAPMIFWQPADPSLHFTSTFFASYYYHANAGAFLNLVLAPIAGLSFWIIRRGSPILVRTLWLVLFLFVALAILSNTSRMAQAVGGLIFLILLGAVARSARRIMARTEKRTLVLGCLLGAMTILAVAQAVRLDRPLRRWNDFSEQLPDSARWTADRVALAGVGDAGFFGFGPGTFQTVFPHYQRLSGNQPPGVWRFLHNDYLQTILEWGWLGSVAIAALFFGGIGIGIRNYFNAENWSNRQRILLSCVLLALIGVAIHALVDFPLQILSIQLLVAAYLGICWGSSDWRRSEVGGRRSDR